MRLSEITCIEDLSQANDFASSTIGTTASKAEVLRKFGGHLNCLIYDKFRSKDAFLAETGIHKANLHKIITGSYDPQLTTLWRISRGLHVPMGEMFQNL